MRTELIITDPQFDILSRIITASVTNKKITRIGTSIGHSFLLSVGDRIDGEGKRKYIYEWNVHVFNCKWKIYDASGDIIRSWDLNPNLNDLGKIVIGLPVKDFQLGKDRLSIRIDGGIEISIYIELVSYSEDEDSSNSEDTTLLAIEHQIAWSLNMESNGNCIVDL